MTDFAYVAGPVGRLASRVTFSRAEWTRLAGLYGFIGVLHLMGWGLYLHYAVHYPQLVGLGFVAYMFGLRHAFDADHIAAVDDSVRFMLQKGKKPLGVGLLFSAWAIPRWCSRWRLASRSPRQLSKHNCRF